MNNRYFLKLAFDGTRYNGWQVQKNAHSVQAEVNKALSTLLREEINTTGAGRTDTGVHARKFFAHFDSTTVMDQAACAQLAYKLNHLLPVDIAINGLYPVHLEAHARFDAISRTYQYLICTQKDPFLNGKAWYMEKSLDMASMQLAANRLLQHSDFSSFAKANIQTKTSICEVKQAVWQAEGHVMKFVISADRFLRNMVRAITGTLVDVGQGKLSPEDFDQIITAKDRRQAGYSAPGHGLYLIDIQYPYTL